LQIACTFARRDNSEQCSVASSETELENGTKGWKAHLYFHQLNDVKLLVVFNSAIISKGLQLYSQIQNLTISNGTLNAIFLNAFFFLAFKGLFFSGT
jgi:hypothetical protein